MSALTELKLYLLEKIERINVNNPKANSGGVMLKLYEGHEEEMDDILTHALQTMTWLFIKDSTDNPAGTSSLTNMSTKIGKTVYRYMEREPVSWKDELRLGDLIIEAFYNCGFVNIDYPARRDSSHIIRVTTKWERFKEIPDADLDITLVATLTDKPTNIQGQSNHGWSVLKRGGEINIESPFIRSIDKLQQTGWRINERVFNALVYHGGFVSTVKEKNEAKELKRLSKDIEWKFTKAKGSMLIGKSSTN